MSAPRAQLFLRWLLALVAVAGLGLLAQRLHVLHYIAAGAQRAREAGPQGALWVGLAMIAGTMLLLPIVPMVMATGWIYGLAGLAISLPAATASAAIAFLIGRALGHTSLQAALRTRPKLRALTDLAEQGGVLSVALLRVSPLLPFTPSNAVLGMTSLRLRDLALGTFLGMMPGGLLYTGAGALLPDAEALARGEAPRGPFWAMLVLGLASMAVIGTAAARKLKALQKPPVAGT